MVSLAATRPDDMAAKARAMVALVEAGLAPEAVVNLVSPARPDELPSRRRRAYFPPPR